MGYDGNISSHKVRTRTGIQESGTNKKIINWEDGYMDQSRRQILKFIAAAPLTLTFGFASEALLRFAKPSMKPFGLFDPADQPNCIDQAVFEQRDFPAPWTCIPFFIRMKITEFNPEQQEIHKMQGFIIRLQGHEIVAYSRRCPTGRGCMLSYMANPHNCGCHPKLERCCPCDRSGNAGQSSCADMSPRRQCIRFGP